MNKFGSKHPQLEIVSVAAYRPAYLNRQVIMMMNYNGVPREVMNPALVSDVVSQQGRKYQWRGGER